jgi:uncharacterized protein YbjT (DUF2867 family)
MKRILVTGATGNVGRQVVSQLLARDVRVRAFTRKPNAAGLPPEVELVRGDLTVPATIDVCLDDVDAVFLLWSAPGRRRPAAVDRITRAGPAHHFSFHLRTKRRTLLPTASQIRSRRCTRKSNG